MPKTPKHNNIFGLDVVGFNPCKADPCIWLREMKTKYENIAIYVDDLLIASNKPQQIIQDSKKFELKIKGDGPLQYSLGCDYKQDKGATLVAQPTSMQTTPLNHT